MYNLKEIKENREDSRRFLLDFENRFDYEKGTKIRFGYDELKKMVDVTINHEEFDTSQMSMGRHSNQILNKMYKEIMAEIKRVHRDYKMELLTKEDKITKLLYLKRALGIINNEKTSREIDEILGK